MRISKINVKFILAIIIEIILLVIIVKFLGTMHYPNPCSPRSLFGLLFQIVTFQYGRMCIAMLSLGPHPLFYIVFDILILTIISWIISIVVRIVKKLKKK